MNERLSDILSNRKTAPIIVGVISFGVGLGAGYIFGKRNRVLHIIPADEQMKMDFSAKKAFDKDAMEEWITKEEAKHGIVREKKPKPDTTDPETWVSEKIKETMADNTDPERIDLIPQDQEQELITRHIFPDTVDTWNYDEEISKRKETEPHVLHKDEFYAEELNYTQTTLTYYAGDDILADEDDKPIYNYANVVGPLLFGHGSGDPNVFHVRNDKLKAEYEILNDPGLFSVEVLGLEIENNQRVKNIKHGDNRRLKDVD